MAVFRQALLSAGFIGGRVVEEFENAFAAFCGLVGFISLIAGTVSLIHESRLAVRSLVLEAEDAAGAINRALAPNTMTELEAGL